MSSEDGKKKGWGRGGSVAPAVAFLVGKREKTGYGV